MKKINHQNNSLSTRHPELVSGSEGVVGQHAGLNTHKMLKQVQHDKVATQMSFYTPQTLKQVQGDGLRVQGDGLRMDSAFTLAEVMIVLAIIGILTAILLPVAHNSTPNENILKFKKAHNTLYTTIRELVNSDKYYLNGDLEMRADGTLIDGTHVGDNSYFCKAFGDIISSREINCSDTCITSNGAFHTTMGSQHIDDFITENVPLVTLLEARGGFDNGCKNGQSEMGEEIITADSITYFQRGNCAYFRKYIYDNFDIRYKVVCIDIDGINQGEDPFGYGVRADGKILNGVRAEEWLQNN